MRAMHLPMSIKGRSARQRDPADTQHCIPLVLPARIAALPREKARIFVDPVDSRAIDAWSEITPGGAWTLKWLMQPGDVVSARAPVVALSTASEMFDVLSPVDGVLVEIFTGGGEVVGNTVLGLIKPAHLGAPEILTEAHPWGIRSDTAGIAGRSVEVGEGYLLEWDACGLLIRVNDHRPRPLKLSWGQLSEYARSVDLPVDQRSRIAWLLKGPLLESSVNTTGAPEILDITEEADMSAETVAKLGPLGLSIILIHIMLRSALQKGATEIHIEPRRKELSVAYRVGQRMWGVMRPPRTMRHVITGHIKTMAKVDAAEKRFSQHGTIRLRHHHNGAIQESDLFVSFWPTRFGETILIRVPSLD
jgi:pyruvate/2-oxoglutarate dehydrogenase complex dihydrolipoamide acyltransferase (E2) component